MYAFILWDLFFIQCYWHISILMFSGHFSVFVNIDNIIAFTVQCLVSDVTLVENIVIQFYM